MRSLAFLAAAACIALTGAVAHAQQPTPTAPGGPGPRAPMTRADLDALTDARIAGIQAGLKLNADQQKLWVPVEQALRTMASTRAQRLEEFRNRRQARNTDRNTDRPDMMQMLERRSEWTSQSADNLRALTTALKPFWASLDEQQKKLLPILMRPEGGGPRRWRDVHGGRGGPMRHMEQGQPGQPGQPPAPRP